MCFDLLDDDEDVTFVEDCEDDPFGGCDDEDEDYFDEDEDDFDDLVIETQPAGDDGE